MKWWAITHVHDRQRRKWHRTRLRAGAYPPACACSSRGLFVLSGTFVTSRLIRTSLRMLGLGVLRRRLVRRWLGRPFRGGLPMDGRIRAVGWIVSMGFMGLSCL